MIKKTINLLNLKINDNDFVKDIRKNQEYQKVTVDKSNRNPYSKDYWEIE